MSQLSIAAKSVSKVFSLSLLFSRRILTSSEEKTQSYVTAERCVVKYWRMLLAFFLLFSMLSAYEDENNKENYNILIVIEGKPLDPISSKWN